MPEGAVPGIADIDDLGVPVDKAVRIIHVHEVQRVAVRPSDLHGAIIAGIAVHIDQLDPIIAVSKVGGHPVITVATVPKGVQPEPGCSLDEHVAQTAGEVPHLHVVRPQEVGTGAKRGRGAEGTPGVQKSGCGDAFVVDHEVQIVVLERIQLHEPQVSGPAS